MMKLLEQVRALAMEDGEIIATLADLALPLADVRVVYRIEDPCTGAAEETVLAKGNAQGVRLVYRDVTQAVVLEVHPALLRERAGRENVLKSI
jgi:hypothetical protein